MIFFWKKHRNIKYIEFDKSKEPKFATEKEIDIFVRKHKECLSEFIDTVITYIRGKYPILVDFKTSYVETITSNIIIDKGVDPKNKSVSSQLETYLKKVSSRYKGGVFES